MPWEQESQETEGPGPHNLRVFDQGPVFAHIDEGHLGNVPNMPCELTPNLPPVIAPLGSLYLFH